MTLVFPRAMPTTRFRPGSLLALERQQTMAPTRGGLVQVAELGAPLWKMRYMTVPMGEAQGLAWEAWISSLRGGARTFKAVHPARRTAVAYPNGYGGLNRHAGGAFDGTATLQAVAVALETVTLSGLPSTFKLSDGDLLSFVPSGTRQALHRVTEGGTASAGVLTVAIEPSIRPGYTLNASVALASPWAKAVIDQSTVQIDWQLRRICSVSFDAWQTLA